MKSLLKILFLLSLFLPNYTQASSNNLSGRILLDVERNGEAWYIYPIDNKRYYLGRPLDAFTVMRKLGLGITEIEFQKIAQAGMEVDGDLELTKRIAGKIVLQVEKNGEAWYINPLDLKKYYLGRPQNAFEIMRKLGLGITRKDLAKIHKPGFDESLNQYSKYTYRKKVIIKEGAFDVDEIEIDLNNPNLKIITETAQNFNCKKNCSAKKLADFVFENNGFAGMNGSYFDSYSNLNYYFAPIYNSRTKTFINSDQLKYWTTGAIIAFDTKNNFYYFKDSREFPVLDWYRESKKSVADAFYEKYKKKLQAVISNKPRLIEDGMNALIDWDTDDKQKNQKLTRSAIGYQKNNQKGKIFLIIVRRATINNLAEVLKKMEIDYALNMDGGYSSALIYNDEYMVGPGRDIPNAIVFSQ